MKLKTGLLLLILIGCRGGGTTPEDGSSCSAVQPPTGEVVVTCDDGTSGVVDKAPGCQLKTDPAGRGILINCPPSTDWLLIRSGEQGEPGKDCAVLKSARANDYLTCDAGLHATKISLNGINEDTATCSSIGLAFSGTTGFCKGRAE